jgi:AraC family transcriptional regulator
VSRKSEDILNKIRRLVGEVTSGQLRYVDSFVSDDVGLFLPVGGACFYALTPEHTHPSYMFVLHFDDQTAIKLNCRTIMAQHGKLFLLSPGIPHQELPSDFPPRYIAVMIDKQFFEMQLSYYKVKVENLCLGFYNPAQDLISLLNKFMLEADNAVPGYEAVLHALGLEISHSIIRSILDCKPIHDRISGRVEIGGVVEFMHSNLDRKITLAEMADVARMSTSHFSHIFKEDTGRSPLVFLNEIRMRRVKKLLIAGDKTITEIALECGFGSPAYLTASFCKKFKITPSKFKKLHKEKQNI